MSSIPSLKRRRFIQSLAVVTAAEAMAQAQTRNDSEPAAISRSSASPSEPESQPVRTNGAAAIRESLAGDEAQEARSLIC